MCQCIVLLGETGTIGHSRHPPGMSQVQKTERIKLINHRGRERVMGDCCKVAQRSHKEPTLHSEALLEKSQI